MVRGDATRKRRANARRRTLNLLHDVTDVNTIIQVGLGDWAEGPVLLALFPEANYLAVEPIDRYRETAKGNGFPGVIFPGICWSVSGQEFRFADQRTETSVYEAEGGLGVIVCTSTTLDDIVRVSAERFSPDPILLWMDCEGAESEVLRGANEMLPHVKYIVMELKDEPTRSLRYWLPAHKMINLLGELGFFLIKRDSDGLFVNSRYKGT